MQVQPVLIAEAHQRWRHLLTLEPHATRRLVDPDYFAVKVHPAYRETYANSRHY